MKRGHEQLAEGLEVVVLEVSHASQADDGRITGIRSWMRAISSLAEVVMMVVERNGSASSSSAPSSSLGRRTSHSPASTNGSPSGDG